MRRPLRDEIPTFVLGAVALLSVFRYTETKDLQWVLSAQLWMVLMFLEGK